MIWMLIALACGTGPRLERADASLRAGDLAAAEKGYRNVLDRAPEDVAALYGLGWVFHQSGDPGRAREYFKRCVRVAPDDYRGHRGLGSVALSEGNFVQAHDHFTAALAAAPDEPRVHTSMGLVYLGSDQVTESLTHFERARELEPERGEYAYNLADALFRLERFDESLDVIEQGMANPIDEVRFRAMLLELRALVRVRMTGGRVDPSDCAGTAPPVLEWLSAADESLDQAAALGADLPNLPAARRRVATRRSNVTQTCPSSTYE